jgi:phosphate transporter
MYVPWSDHYIAYDRLKRLIDRKVFLKKKMEAKKHKLDIKDVEAAATELTPLKGGDREDSYSNFQEEASDSRSFICEVDRELDKINKFFDSKLMELRVQLEELMEKWQEQHSTHHTTHLLSSHLVEFRRIFLLVSALEAYGPLNRTGFYKIIKKYDKNMNEKNIKTYMIHVDEQNFVASKEPSRLIELIAGYVSRSKLVEWKHASEDDGRDSEILFPAISPNALAISVIIFIISFQLPPLSPDNPNANRCLSLLLLVVSLWLTNAMPYFATAMLVPVMIPVLRVMREVNSSGDMVDMSSEEAAKVILNNFFNHTTVLSILSFRY